MITVAAVDDDRMLLDGLASWLAEVPDVRLVARASTVADLLADPTEQPTDGVTDGGVTDGGVPADLVMLDLLLADGSTPAANVRQLTEAGYPVLVMSVSHDREQILAAFTAGARGYVTKDNDLPALLGAIREIASGGTAFSPELAFACLRDSRPQRPQLSEREHQVLLAYASGMTLTQSARYVGIRPETARTYLERVKDKYQQVGRPARTKLELADRVREDDLRGRRNRGVSP